ncbi:MAG TPA: hypothetical protein VHM69_14110 [Rubrobacter sp.]|nr:hypothetical protein [Rubrobacter sp.]
MSARESRRVGDQRSPLFARVVAWLVVLIYVAGTGANIWLQDRLDVQGDPLLEDVLLRAGFGAFAVVGALLIAKRPTNLVGCIMAVIGIMVGIFPAGDSYAAYVMTTRGHPDALAIVGAWAQGWYWYLLLALALIYLPLLFPDGRLPSRRWLPFALMMGTVTLTLVILGALIDTLSSQDADYRIENPIGVESLAPVESLPVFGVFGVLLGVGLVGAIGAVIVRFRRARGIERQQMKWFLYAAALIPSFLALDYLPGILSSVVLGLVILALPTAIGIAVLRYRLYDIDLVVNRTLVYGSLTAALVLVYLGGVVSLQYVFRAFTGSESQFAVVVSTLAIAGLFNPLRHRVQTFVDRRFYRRKYDAVKTLEAFGSRLRDDTDLDDLSGHLIEVVRETMQPAHVSLWMRTTEQGAGKRAGA